MNKNTRYLVSAYGLGENLSPLVHSEPVFRTLKTEKSA